MNGWWYGSRRSSQKREGGEGERESKKEKKVEKESGRSSTRRGFTEGMLTVVGWKVRKK
jgi:hypothetical protein